MKTNVKVENMTSRNGNDIPNQFIIRTDKGTFFQSYKSVIAFEAKDGTIQLDADKWDYSVTTGKYRNQFLGEDKKQNLNNQANENTTKNRLVKMDFSQYYNYVYSSRY